MGSQSPAGSGGTLYENDRPCLAHPHGETTRFGSVDLTDAISEAWSTHLGIAIPSSRADFFELGGDSLKALGVLADLADVGIELSLSDFYASPTISAQATCSTVVGTGGSTLAEPRVGDEPECELTPLQTAILVEGQRESRDPFWISQLYQLPRGVEFEAVASAWAGVVALHPALRTVLDLDAVPPRQAVRSASSTVGRSLERRVAPLGSTGDLQRLVEERRSKATVGISPLAFAAYVQDRAQPEVAVWSLVIHHVVFDGTTLGQVVDDFFALLSGADLPSPHPSVASYAHWCSATAAQERSREYWRDAVGALSPGELRVSERAPDSTPRAAARAAASRRVGPLASARLADLAGDRRFTTAAAVSYVWAQVLAQYVRGGPVVLGLTVNLRASGMPDATRVSGCLLGMVPVVVNDDDADAAVACRALMNQIARGTEYAHLPPGEILRGGPAAELGVTSTVVFENFAGSERYRQALLVEVGGTNDPLSLTVTTGASIDLLLEWDARKLTKETAVELLEALQHWLEHPTWLDERDTSVGWTTPAQHSRSILGDPGIEGTAVARSWDVRQLLHGSPDELAVVDSTTTLTYAELTAWSEVWGP